mmetsp:Transcript_23013/g.55824  ORF Transcript_23013/g.55824 Transcript_23013/m.55824 type:complete len:85 (+) Transcript_23013:1372-1626(+)
MALDMITKQDVATDKKETRSNCSNAVPRKCVQSTDAQDGALSTRRRLQLGRRGATGLRCRAWISCVNEGDCAVEVGCCVVFGVN